MSRSFLILVLVFLTHVCSAAEPDAGKELFENRCALCHRGSGPGVFMLERRLGADFSILEERAGLNAEFLSTVVRMGIGSMPRFTRGELSDAELEQLSRYLISRAQTED